MRLASFEADEDHLWGLEEPVLTLVPAPLLVAHDFSKKWGEELAASFSQRVTAEFIKRLKEKGIRLKDLVSSEFAYPSTRYSGSKRRLLGWIWEHVKELKFDSVLDLFGGTASVSLLFKRYGKRVYYNDLFKFNQLIGKALVENKETKVTASDLERVLLLNGNGYPDFIQKNFKGIFFLDEENAWLDKVVANISQVRDEYKRSILFASLFQACLSKRPFNLFHRANFYLRTADVPRSFGNKTTWDHPFEDMLVRYVGEYNRAVFDNGRDNLVIGGYDACLAPNGVDLVYMDPPYFSSKNGGTDYLAYYHFLEGIADYENWGNRINGTKSKIRQIAPFPEVEAWTRRDKIRQSFKKLIERFQDNIVVLSYRSEGIPSPEEIMEMLKSYKKDIKVYSRPHRSALSRTIREELLFIAK